MIVRYTLTLLLLFSLLDCYQNGGEEWCFSGDPHQVPAQRNGHHPTSPPPEHPKGVPTSRDSSPGLLHAGDGSQRRSPGLHQPVESDAGARGSVRHAQYCVWDCLLPQQGNRPQRPQV